jgi:hypothetical protein
MIAPSGTDEYQSETGMKKAGSNLTNIAQRLSVKFGQPVSQVAT